MPDNENSKSENHEHHHHEEHGVRLVFRVLIPIIFLVSGLTLLAFRIGGWSIIFGLPMITLGVVFLIYTYDELVTRTVKPIPDKIVECSVCGKPTTKLYPWQDEKEVICLKCREDIARGIKRASKA